MLETTKKFIEDANEIKEAFIKELGTEMFENMDGDQFMIFKSLFKLMKTSEDLMLKQAELLESMNKKLDQLSKEES